MKKLLLLLLFIPLVSFGQTIVGDFKINNGEIIWQKIYNDSLKIESQDLILKPIGLPFNTTIYLKQVSNAKLIVDHKNGRTRLTVKNIYAIDDASYTIYGVTTNPDKPTYAHEIYVKNRKGVFSSKFLKKDGKLLNDIIEREIKSLTTKDDDW